MYVTEEILNDSAKFSKLNILAGKENNHIINIEKRITSELTLLKNKEINDKPSYKSIKPASSRPGILCLVVKALDSQFRGPVFKTTGWLQGRLSLSSFRGRSNEYQ